MAAFYKGYTLEELYEEGILEYPPPGDQSVWNAARELWATPADAAAAAAAYAAAATTTTNAASNSGSNNTTTGAAVPPVAAPAAPAPAPAAAAAAPAAVAGPAAAPTAAAAAAGTLPVRSARLAALADAALAEPGVRRRWDAEEEAYLVAARLAGNNFEAIGGKLGRTAAACETKAKGNVYKGGKKPGE